MTPEQVQSLKAVERALERFADLNDACRGDNDWYLADKEAVEAAQAALPVLRALAADKAEAADPDKLRMDIAAATAHRGCCGTEHDPDNGKIQGYCVVCGVPWPCDTARAFLRRVEEGGTNA